MRHWKKILTKYKKAMLSYSVLTIIGLILVFLFLDLVKELIIIVMFILANVFLRFYRRILPGVPLEFEVVIFGSVLTTVIFGFWAGVIVAVFSPLLAEFLNQNISPYSLVNVVCYLLVPVVTFIMKGMIIANPAAVIGYGISITIIVNIIIFFTFVFIGYDLIKNAAYSITNIFFNYLLFTYLSSMLLTALL